MPNYDFGPWPIELLTAALTVKLEMPCKGSELELLGAAASRLGFYSTTITAEEVADRILLAWPEG